MLNKVSTPLSGAIKKALLTGGLLLSSTAMAAKGTFLVQMNDYEGRAAYFALYLIDDGGKYVKTLWVSGTRSNWQEEGMPRWWKMLGRAPQNLDAITGASTPSGERNLIKIDIDDKYLNGKYKVRLDTSVEDQENYPVDVEAALSKDIMKKKIEGTGYVRYFRFKWE